MKTGGNQEPDRPGQSAAARRPGGPAQREGREAGQPCPNTVARRSSVGGRGYDGQGGPPQLETSRGETERKKRKLKGKPLLAKP